MTRIPYRRWILLRIRRQLLDLPGVGRYCLRKFLPVIPWLVVVVLTLGPSLYFFGPEAFPLWLLTAFPIAMYLALNHVNWEFGDDP